MRITADIPTPGNSRIVVVRNAALRVGCQLRVTRPQGIVTRVLEMTGLLAVLTAPLRPNEPTPPHAGSLTIPRHGQAGPVVQVTINACAA